MVFQVDSEYICLGSELLLVKALRPVIFLQC